MVQHRDSCQARNEFSQYHSQEKMPFIGKDETLILREMPIS